MDNTLPFYRQPLLHFLILGGLIFGVHSLFGGVGNGSSNRIIVTVPQVERMAGLWFKTWGRVPTDAELQGLIRDHIKEEIYYREALKLGLDINDTVIRRRLRQKMEFMTTSDEVLISATDELLEVYLLQQAAEFIRGPQYSFEQIYFTAEQKELALSTLERLTHTADVTDHNELGSIISLPRRLNAANEREVSRVFGEQFYASLDSSPVGQWFGPVESGFGLHLVFITDKRDSYLPKLSEIRQAVENHWLANQRDQAGNAAFAQYLENYDVQIDLSLQE